MDINGKMKLSFDEFFFKFMQERFKLKKVINKHIEETLMAVLLYDKTDERIMLLKRFLGLDENDRLRREVLDIYLSIIKG